MLDGFIPEEKEEIPLEQHFCLFWNLYFETSAWDIFRVYWLCYISHRGCLSLGYPAVCWLLFPIWQGFLFRCVCRAAGLSREEKRQQNITWLKMVLQQLCSVASLAFHSMKDGRGRKFLHIPAWEKINFQGKFLPLAVFKLSPCWWRITHLLGGLLCLFCTEVDK